MNLHTIDLGFLGIPNSIAAYVLETPNGAVLFETGPHSRYTQLCAEIKKLGIEPASIKHVFITHIHLDHAGAAWAFAEQGATIYVHPFGKKHLADPSKLLISAQRIYKERMYELWGDLNPIPETQLYTVEHGKKFTIDGIEIVAWHTPGHAVHHIAWQIGKDLITGDVAGVSIGGGMVVPPCPPPDINIEDWLASIALIRGLAIEAMYLTHFGKITAIETHLDALENILWDWANWMKPHWEAKTDPKDVTPLFMKYTADQLRKNGANELQVQQYEAANPSWMSVVGLMRYWRKKEAV